MCPDTVFINGTLFNALTKEFIKDQSIWVKNGIIAYVGPASDFSKSQKTLSIDADGMVLLPGLIEGHTHTLSYRYSIEEFIKHVIPSGVTTVITETMELATIVGKDGIEYFAKGLEGQPIRFYYTVAPLCGVISLKPMEIVGDEVRKLEESLKKNGVKWEKPILAVDTLGTPAIPNLRITHHGYVRLKDREILSLEI
jgi:adenine deaminase